MVLDEGHLISNRNTLQSKVQARTPSHNPTHVALVKRDTQLKLDTLGLNRPALSTSLKLRHLENYDISRST